MRIDYKDISDLSEDIRHFSQDLPLDIDLVVGIPRSGLLAANILCLHLDLPMADVDSLCEGEMFDSGNRFENSPSFDEIETVLVVDDSVNSGAQMTETRNRLAEHEFPFDIRYGAVYISPSGHEYVDYWGDVIHGPQVFEWNVLNHPNLETWSVAMEGILCRKPTPEERATEETYREYIAEVEPRGIPNHPIGWLVTRRSEKYRALTEEWLNTHGVEFETLVMWNRSNREQNQERNGFTRFKAEVYDSTDAELFIESDRLDAVEIRDRTNRPVFCHGTYEMIRPRKIERAYRDGSRYLSKFKRDPVTFSLRASDYLVSRIYHVLHRLRER